MRDDQRLQLAQQVTVAAQPQVELDPLDCRGETLLVQARPLALEQLVRARSTKRRPAPDIQRLLDRQPRRRELTGRAGTPRPAQRRLPTVDIARAGAQLQDIATRPPDQLPSRLPPPAAPCAAAIRASAGWHERALEDPPPTAHRSTARCSPPGQASTPAAPATPEVDAHRVRPVDHPPTPQPDRAPQPESHCRCPCRPFAPLSRA